VHRDCFVGNLTEGLACRQYNARMDTNPHPSPPYAELTPDCVLDALSSVGLSGDGRLLSLNSYENRVYQVWLDDREPAADIHVQRLELAPPRNSTRSNGRCARATS